VVTACVQANRAAAPGALRPLPLQFNAHLPRPGTFRASRPVDADALEIDGADHGMFLPWRLAASAAVLGQVVTVVEDFFDQQVWPRCRPDGKS